MIYHLKLNKRPEYWVSIEWYYLSQMLLTQDQIVTKRLVKYWTVRGVNTTLGYHILQICHAQFGKACAS